MGTMTGEKLNEPKSDPSLIYFIKKGLPMTNTFTHTDIRSKIPNQYESKKKVIGIGRPTYRQTELETHSVHTHKHKRCTVTVTHRLAVEPSSFNSSVGLTGSYLVSIELCACLQHAEQNSHSGPKSFSLCEYERKTRSRGGRADMKTTMWK